MCSESYKDRKKSIAAAMSLLPPWQQEMIRQRARDLRAALLRRKKSAKIGDLSALELVLALALRYDVPA